MKKKLMKLTCLTMTLVLALSACGNSASPDAPAADKDTLTVAVSADPPTLDPHAASLAQSINALNPVYETLVRYDDKGEIQPLLAESWEQLDDLSWQFNLRKGVKFHNGEEMKASDVLFSLQRATGSDGAKISHVMYIIDSANCEVVDDYTIIIRTKMPFSPFLTYMTFMGACVVSEKAFTENTENAVQSPCGTGPFAFVSWQKNDRTTYVRNEAYWGTQPAYQNLIIKTIVEANSRVIELETGTVDIAYEIPKTEMERIANGENTKIESQNSTTYEYLGMNCSKFPFDDPQFRLAIEKAINWDDLVNYVYGESAVLTNSPVTPGMKYSISDTFASRYDPEGAKEILRSLGIKEGTTFKLTTWNAKHRVDCATIMQSMLKEVGLNIEIDAVELATWSNDLETGNTDFFIAGFGAIGFPDPDMNIFGPLHKDQIPFSNYCYYDNSDLSALIDESRTTVDGPERGAIIEEVQKIVWNEAPMVPYANTKQVVGLRRNVMGFTPTSAQNHFVHSVYFAD